MAKILAAWFGGSVAGALVGTLSIAVTMGPVGYFFPAIVVPGIVAGATLVQSWFVLGSWTTRPAPVVAIICICMLPTLFIILLYALDIIRDGISPSTYYQFHILAWTAMIGATLIPSLPISILQRGQVIGMYQHRPVWLLAISMSTLLSLSIILIVPGILAPPLFRTDTDFIRAVGFAPMYAIAVWTVIGGLGICGMEFQRRTNRATEPVTA